MPDDLAGLIQSYAVASAKLRQAVDQSEWDNDGLVSQCDQSLNKLFEQILNKDVELQHLLLRINFAADLLIKNYTKGEAFGTSLVERIREDAQKLDNLARSAN